jgi:hypothetical protein
MMDARSFVPHVNAKTVLANFSALSMFGQFDYELESLLLNRKTASMHSIYCPVM